MSRENAFLEHDQNPAHQDAVADYRKMLAYQKLDELRAIARSWDLRLRSTSKAAIIEQMAERFSEPDIQASILEELDELGRQVLAYLHLVLAPGYGLSADNVVRGMLHLGQRAVEPVRAGEPLSSLYAVPSAQDVASRRGIQERIVGLAECGILLPFRQGSVLYYTLPDLVRARLPAQPDLVSAYSADTASLHVRELSFGKLIHKLFTIWNTCAQGIPGADGPLVRRTAPSRQPIEDQWALLRGWDHEPSEISALMRHQYPGGRSSPMHLERVAASTLNWAMTVPAPLFRLQDADLRHLCSQVSGSDEEVEFYYALLESLGTLSGLPGQPIAVRRDGLQHFLRFSAANKIQALWQAWVDDETWSEMQIVLREDRRPALRLRRSLAHHNYTAQDLYHEWHIGRKVVLRFLSLLPENQWLSVEDLLKKIFDVHPRLLHTVSDPSVWWLESPRTGRQFGTAFEDWQQSYGQFVLSLLQGPLQWLGIVRLGYPRPSVEDAARFSREEPVKPVAFQLTEIGAFAFGRHGELDSMRAIDSPVDKSPCSVSEDLTVSVVPDRASLELHNLLHSAGRLVDATPDRFIYQLTAEGIARWLDAGSSAEAAALTGRNSVETLIELLDQHCQASDTRWREKLRTWERNRGLLHIYENMTLIELADDYALQELLISTSLGDHLVYQFSPRLVAIWADGVDALVQDMERRGYTPRIQ